MMYYTQNKGYSVDLDEDLYKTDRFRNFETLNIFCDGSYTAKNSRDAIGGYSAVGVVCYDVKYVTYRGWSSMNNFSINVMELFALKEAISMGFMNKNRFQNINIFSDSSYAINSIKTWIYKWTFDPNTQMYMNKGVVPANIDLIYEVATNFINLMMNVNNLNLYFVKGHIKHYGSLDEIKQAMNTFKRINDVKGKIDIGLIRYLSKYNDVADKYAKLGAKELDYNCNMYTPIEFIPQDINKLVQNNLISNIQFT